MARTLTYAELEEHLDKLLCAQSPDTLNRYRDEARVLAPQLKLEEEFRELDDLIGTLLGSRSERLTSPLVQARVDGDSYDPKCLKRVRPDRTSGRASSRRRVMESDRLCSWSPLWWKAR